MHFVSCILGAVIGLLGVASYALAGGGRDHIASSVLSGYEENPDISTVAKGTFDAQIGDADTTITYKLSYSGLEGDVQQAHIHFGKPAINGGISVFLCSNLGNGPTGTPSCPQSGTVRGTLDAADVVGPAAQGIEAQAFAGARRRDTGRAHLRERSLVQMAGWRDPRPDPR